MSPPEFFVDRSLGRRVVPDALRAAGAVVHAMADVYGEDPGQGLADEAWLRDVGDRGWVVLMKDNRIRYRPAELAAVEAAAVRAFCVTAGNLRGDEQATRLLRHLPQITEIATTVPGPYVYGVYADDVRRLWPR